MRRYYFSSVLRFYWIQLVTQSLFLILRLYSGVSCRRITFSCASVYRRLCLPFGLTYFSASTFKTFCNIFCFDVVDTRSCQSLLCPEELITPRKEVCSSSQQVNRRKVLTGWVYGQVYLRAGITGDSQSGSDMDKQAKPSAKTSSRIVTASRETLTGTRLKQTLSVYSQNHAGVSQDAGNPRSV